MFKHSKVWIKSQYCEMYTSNAQRMASYMYLFSRRKVGLLADDVAPLNGDVHESVEELKVEEMKLGESRVEQ